MITVEKLLERRNKQRLEYPFKISHAAFNFPGGGNPLLVSGKIINVSAIGVLFESNEKYKPETLIRVEIRLGSWDHYKTGYSSFQSIYQGEPFVALAKVLRVAEKQKNGKNYFEIAVKYVSVDEGHRQAVSKFINKFNKSR